MLLKDSGGVQLVLESVVDTYRGVDLKQVCRASILLEAQ